MREEGGFHWTEEQQVEYEREREGAEREREKRSKWWTLCQTGKGSVLCFGMGEKEQNIKIRMKKLTTKRTV